MRMNREEILKELKSLHDPVSVEGMKRGGINPDKAFGVKIPVLRKMAKRIKKNHNLALELWDLGYRETMILAAMIDDPAQVTENQMERWVLSEYFSYWEVVDQTCMNLFYLTEFAYQKAIECIPNDAVFHRNLSRAYRGIKNYDKAIIENENAYKLNPDESAYKEELASIYNAKGNDLYSSGKYAEAIDKYKETIKLVSDDDIYLSNLAGAYENLKETTSRLEALDKAIYYYQKA